MISTDCGKLSAITTATTTVMAYLYNFDSSVSVGGLSKTVTN
ncbi:MAG: hypothetical protein ACRD5B_18410 [Nitrososphaeraceae archaeon]